MNPVTVLNNHVAITFNKRTLLTTIIQSKIESALDVNSIENNDENIIASNFAVFLSRTQSVDIITDTPSEIAADFAKFWEYAQGRTDYEQIYVAYISQCHDSINGVWADAYRAHENADPTLNDPDLVDASMLPDSVLADEDVKKNESNPEDSGVTT
jgi:hypothetical protein